MKSLVEVLEGFYGTVTGGGIFCEPATERRFIKLDYLNRYLNLYVFPTFTSSNIPTNIVKEILNLKLFAKRRVACRSKVSGVRERSYVSLYTFQQMKEVFAELIRKGKCIEEIKVLREIYKYVQTHESLANRAALGSMISLIFTLAALKHDKHIELPQNPSLEDIFRIVKDGSQEDIDYIFATWSNHRYDGVFNYDIEWFERLLPEEEQDS